MAFLAKEFENSVSLKMNMNKYLLKNESNLQNQGRVP